MLVKFQGLPINLTYKYKDGLGLKSSTASPQIQMLKHLLVQWSVPSGVGYPDSQEFPTLLPSLRCQ